MKRQQFFSELEEAVLKMETALGPRWQISVAFGSGVNQWLKPEWFTHIHRMRDGRALRISNAAAGGLEIRIGRSTGAY